MTISWAGHTWNVRSGTGDPGGNNWSSSPNNVWVDAQNNLHLKITNIGRKWYCASVNTTDSVGYGTYTINMVTNPSNPALDNNTVMGLFYWLDANSELDIEYARWNDPNNTNYGKYTVQGSGGGASSPYKIDVANSVNTMVWYPSGNVEFSTKDSFGNIISSWNYTGTRHPVPGGTFCINLWLYAQTRPSDGVGKELILSNFIYSTSTSPTLMSITISPSTAPINVGTYVQLGAICKDQNNNTITCPTLTWTSDDTTKVTVDSTGKVTGIAAGTANVTAKSGSVVSNQSAITVIQPIDNKFSVYNVTPGTVVNNTGVLAILDQTGTFTKDQACVEICRLLGMV